MFCTQESPPQVGLLIAPRGKDYWEGRGVRLTTSLTRLLDTRRVLLATGRWLTEGITGTGQNINTSNIRKNVHEQKGGPLGWGCTVLSGSGLF